MVSMQHPPPESDDAITNSHNSNSTNNSTNDTSGVQHIGSASTPAMAAATPPNESSNASPNEMFSFGTTTTETATTRQSPLFSLPTAEQTPVVQFGGPSTGNNNDKSGNHNIGLVSSPGTTADKEAIAPALVSTTGSEPSTTRPNEIFSFGTPTTPQSPIFSMPTPTGSKTPVFQFSGVSSGNSSSSNSKTRRNRARKQQPPEKRSSFLFLAAEDAARKPGAAALTSDGPGAKSAGDTPSKGANSMAQNSVTTSTSSEKEEEDKKEKKDPVTAKKAATSSMLAKLAACFDTTEMMDLLTGEDFPSELTLAELTNCKDWMGHTPLHLAAYNCVGIEVVRLLLDIHPAAASQGDQNHHTPLHLAFLGAASLAATSGKEAKQTDNASDDASAEKKGKDDAGANKSDKENTNDGKANKSNEKAVDDIKKPKTIIRKDVTAALLEKMDADAKKPTKKNPSLLHLATVNHAYCEPGVLDLVLRSDPAAALRKSSMGRTPLHILLSLLAPLSSSSSSEEISLLRHFLPDKDDGDVVVDARKLAAIADYNGRTPLHAAAYYGVGVKALEVLLEIYPEAATRTDSDGCTPIQLALIGPMTRRIRVEFSRMDQKAKDRFLSNTHDTLKTLLKCASADAPTVVETKSKQSLLHLAVGLSDECDFFGLELLETILQTDPSLNLHQDVRGRTPLHAFFSRSLGSFLKLLELETKLEKEEEERNRKRQQEANAAKEDKEGEDKEEREEWDHRRERVNAQVKLLLRNAEKSVVPPGKTSEPVLVTLSAASLKDREGQSPLHIVAAEHGFAMNAVLDACPAAARSKDCEGRLPLFLALDGGLCPSRVKMLMQAYPDAVYEKDNVGRTALHILLQENCFENSDLFDQIFQANKGAAFQRDKDGRTPLMFALETGHDPDRRELQRHIVSSILESCPLSEGENEDGDEKTALHSAVESRLPHDIIEMVLQSYPAAAGKRNRNQRTPLRIAIGLGKGDWCSLFLSSWPQAARTLMEKDTVALHHVKCMNCLVPVLRAWPEAALHAAKRDDEGGVGGTPLHYWMGCLTTSCSLDPLAALQEVERCLGNLNAVKAVDGNGLTPLHSALTAHNAFANGERFAQILSDKKHIVALLRAYPEALFLPTSNGRGGGRGDRDDDGNDNDGSTNSIVQKLQKLDSGSADALEALLRCLPKSSSVSFLSSEYAELSKPDLSKENQVTAPGDSSDQGRESDQKSTKEEQEAIAPMQKEGEEDMWTVRLVHQVCGCASEPSICRVIELCHGRHAKCLQTPLENRLPLHNACRSSECPLEVVQLLTSLYGSALHGGSSSEKQSLRLPFVEACLFNNSLDVLYHLLQSAPDVLMSFFPCSE